MVLLVLKIEQTKIELNLTLQKIGLISYLHLEISTWNLLLQCKI
jgi:hypothetical protein